MTLEPSLDKRALLSRHWLLKGFDGAALDRLVRYVRVARYAPGQLIFSKGDPGTSMLAVAKGRVKISSTGGDGKEVVLNLIDAGEVFGEIALLDGGERTADARAMGDTELLVLDRRDFIPLLERDPQVSIRLLHMLCSRIRRTSEQVEDSVFLLREARLAKILLRLIDEFGRETPDGVCIDFKLSQREFGQLAGMTRESMNKQLKEWRESRLIELHEGLVTVRDRARLERIVADSA